MGMDQALEGIVKQNVDKKVQKGASFLNGGGEAAMGVVTQAAGVAAIGTQMSQVSTEELQQIAQQLIAAAAGKIAEESAKLTAEYATKNATLLASIPGTISKAAQDKFNEPGMKKEVNDVVAELAKNREDIEEEKSAKMDEENQKKTMDDTKEKITEGANSAKKFMEDANAQLEKLSEYIVEGPEYVANQMSKLMDSVTDNIKKTLEKSYEENKKKVDEYCKGEGEKIGTRMAEKYNNTIDKAAHKIKDEKDKAVAEAEIKGKSAIQKAKLAIMALTGA